MNKKSWLIVGLSLAMAASIGVGISACGGETHTHEYTKWQYDADQHWKVCPADDAMDPAGKSAHDFTNGDCECGAKKPEHTHTYDAWDYNETQHWKYCDEHGTDKSNIDETTRAPHHFVEGVCDRCKAKEPAMCVYGIGPNFYRKGSWPSPNQVINTKDEWVKMELGDDGKYIADLYLTSDDKFAVMNITTLKSYPDVSALTDALQVETANTYTVTFDPADKTVTFAVHAHTYVWKYDAGQHWKVCSTKDQTVDESSRGTHSYDPETHACVCGAVETVSCEHSNGYAFDYEELPAVEADGGTLQKVCPDCGDTQDVTYVKGIPHLGAGSCLRGSKQTEITENGNYYLTGATGFKFHISQAGTYTIRFEGGILKDQSIVRLYGLGFNKGSYLSTLTFDGAISSAESTANYDEQIAAYGVTIDGYESQSKTTAFKSLSIVIEEDDLTEGDVYVQIGFSNDNSVAVNATNLGYLISVSGFAATSVAPVEVAMLPEKKD